MRPDLDPRRFVRLLCVVGLGLGLASCEKCRGGQGADGGEGSEGAAAGAPVAEAAPEDAPPGPPEVPRLSIEQRAIGGLEIGDTAAAVARAEDLTPCEGEPLLAPTPASPNIDRQEMAVGEGGFGQLRVELYHGRVAMMAARGPDLRIGEDIFAGALLRALDKKWGAPDELILRSRVEHGIQAGFGRCARYEEAPGRLFCVSSPGWLEDPRGWDELVAQKQRISEIYVVASKLPVP